jgi:hypothetical protein
MSLSSLSVPSTPTKQATLEEILSRHSSATTTPVAAVASIQTVVDTDKRRRLNDPSQSSQSDIVSVDSSVDDSSSSSSITTTIATAVTSKPLSKPGPDVENQLGSNQNNASHLRAPTTATNVNSKPIKQSKASKPGKYTCQSLFSIDKHIH